MTPLGGNELGIGPSGNHQDGQRALHWRIRQVCSTAYNISYEKGFLCR